MRGLQAEILEWVSRPGYRPSNASQLAKQMGCTKDAREEFLQALEDLVDREALRRTPKGLIRPAADKNLFAGKLRKTAGGFGFVILNVGPGEKPKPDIFIAPPDIGDAQDGDDVLVRLVKQDSFDSRVRGRIVEVTGRATFVFVGSYFERGGQGYVQIDGNQYPAPILVGDPGAKGARPDDKVVIEMLRFPTPVRQGEAVLTQVLGQRGERGVDTFSIIHEFGLPDQFPEEVLDEARRHASHFNPEQLGERKDLTNELIITIDPVDARDFDDAISLERTKEGHWLLGVHIADVSHFVPSDSALDHEAEKRGTSVYLPDRVLPMLPEVISNGLASLQQGKIRFTKSVFIEYSPTGTVLHTSFENTAICNQRRFTYEEVFAILQEPHQHTLEISLPIRQLLSRMLELAMILRKRRFEAGALELSMSETKIDFDEHGKVSGAHRVSNDVSHQIIEEFMLAANVAVATALNDRDFPFLRRVHSDPDEIKLRRFQEFVGTLGLTLKQCQSRHELQKLLNEVQALPIATAVNYALLRSLKQAQYSSLPEGHYALAEENYCHFTSPIRRYPDLTIHRLFEYLVHPRRKPQLPEAQKLYEQGRRCSFLERRAEQSERELVRVKMLTYLHDKIGLELEAIITGVQDFGFYCQGVELPAEGLVHVSTLGDDYFYYEETSHSLIGRRTGKEFRLGSPVRVRVARVDLDRRQLDLQLASSKNIPSPESKSAPGVRKPKELASGRPPRGSRKPPKATKKGKRRK